MWSKRTRLPRQPPQEPQSPSFGQDSTYGVRSVSEWGGDSDLGCNTLTSAEVETIEEASSVPHDTVLNDDILQAESIPEAEAIEKIPVHSTASTSSSRPALSEGQQESSSSPTSILLPSASIHEPSPPSPESTIHPLDNQPPSVPSPSLLFPLSAGSTEGYIYSSDAETDNSSLALSLSSLPDLQIPASEPSSPASFTSLPSYVASVSSMSRTSSPLGSTVDVPESSRRLIRPIAGGTGGTGVGLASLVSSRTIDESTSGLLGSGDLVLPTLSLPSSSLHLDLSLPHWDGAIGVFRIVLVGAGKEEIERLVRELGEGGEKIVEVSKADFGIVRNDKVVMIIQTSLSLNQVSARVSQCYSKLNDLLNPSVAQNATQQMAKLVEGYIDKSEWIHGVLMVKPDESLGNIGTLVPTIAPSYIGDAPVFNLPAPQPPEISSPALYDPTPMPKSTSQEESSSYFRDTSYSSQHSQLSTVASTLLQILDHRDSITTASISKFLAWRPAPLESSSSSIETSATPASVESESGSGSGSGSHTHPIPTVVRALGSGEWEATLSRRIAKRREGEITYNHNHQGRVRGKPTRSRRHSRSVDNSPWQWQKSSEIPLFSNRKGKVSAPASILGLTHLVEKTFKPMREIFESKWGKVFVVAVAVAVGLGIWGSRR